jgi:hypothetical protein
LVNKANNKAGYLSVSGFTTIFLIILLIMAVLLIGFGRSRSDHYLEVIDEGGKVLLTLPLNKGEEFSLRYLHSVHHTPVKEIFQASPTGELILVATEFSSFGVGTPFLPEEGELTAINGSLLLKGLDRSFPELSLRPLAFTEYQLLHRGTVYLLTDYVESGSLIILKVR